MQAENSQRKNDSTQVAPPALECPICDTLRQATRVNKDRSVSYTCPPDHVTHGSIYRWRIGADGALID